MGHKEKRRRKRARESPRHLNSLYREDRGGEQDLPTPDGVNVLHWGYTSPPHLTLYLAPPKPVASSFAWMDPTWLQHEDGTLSSALLTCYS